ncbi:MAG TPA: STAS domain-containing protein [Patescibacteria group bacterium]|nr:STAS domain-containing protein [Patescibacteria group bacterium]
MDKTASQLKLAEILAPIISSRDLIESLEKIVLKTDSKAVDLDFTNIEFISRSAAHALLLLKEKLDRKAWNKKDVSFVNANKEVKEMLRVVAANRVMPHEKKVSLKTKPVNIETLLEGV